MKRMNDLYSHLSVYTRPQDIFQIRVSFQRNRNGPVATLVAWCHVVSVSREIEMGLWQL